MGQPTRNKIFQVLQLRPLSLLAAAFSIFVIIFEVTQILRGSLYLETLNYIDGTTLIMLGILILWGVVRLQEKTDFQAVVFSFISALSFVFAYEAIFKWSFYLAPFRMQMPAAEFRGFVIDVGIALTVLAGFADKHFEIQKWTVIWLALFVASWIFWLLIGFPQLTGQIMFAPVIKIGFSRTMIYIINRATKVILFLVYLTLFPVQKFKK